MRRLAVAAVIAVLAVLTSWAGTAQAAATELFFSELIEGTSNNKALEIYNGTAAGIDLAAGGYNVQMYFNGSATAGLTINLAGTVASGDVFVLAHASANATILAQADQTNGSGWFNGDDAVVLRKGTTVIDVIGQVGFDPGTEWGTGLMSTADNTLRRKASVTGGDTNGADAFDPSVEWDGFATDTFDGLGFADAAPTVASTTPANGAGSISASANITVTFSEPVDVTGSWYTLSCTVSGTVAASVSGGPTTYTIDPAADLAAGGESCTFTVLAAQVSDQDVIDPPDVMAANHAVSFSTQNVCLLPFTPAYAIQGSGPAAAITGTVTTQGVVVGDYEGSSPTLRGFYLQDVSGDADAATSDAIFVFNGSNNSVGLGDVVRVTGTAGEFQDQTQISTVTGIVPCGTGSVSPVDVALPLASPTALEAVEGMLARLPQALSVTEHFQLGRFGQVVLSSGGRLQQPTAVVAPGAPALALQAANNLNRIILDDGANGQNPDPIVFGRGGLPLSASNTLRGGDTATGIVGVMTYTWAGNAASGNAFRVRPVNALGGSAQFLPANPRPATPPAVGGTLRVAGMNLLNYFNTFGSSACANGVGGTPTDCRGADNAAEFARQHPKTVAAIVGLDPDVLGLVEIENDGYGPTSAIADLVNRLNTATAPGTYALVDVDARTGQVNALGTDAIKVGLIYKPARVTPVGATAALNTVAFVNGGDAGPRNRPSLAQAFQVNDTLARFVVDVNHLKSKGSACDLPDQVDGQGNCNVVRTNAAQELAAWLAADPTGTGDPDVLVIGDLNAYAKEDPVTVLAAAGFDNLVEAFAGPGAYSYAFDGQWGSLDHALGSASLAGQTAGVADWHVNADEPVVLDYNVNFKSAGQLASLYAPDQYRMSDHDPVLVGLDLCEAIPPSLGVSVTPSVLWSPNHKYVTVKATVTASDNSGTPPDVELLSVVSNEPDNGDDDGDTVDDVVIVDQRTLKLRAERSGTGTGRVYTITYRATDGCGNTATTTATVSVPLSR